MGTMETYKTWFTTPLNHTPSLSSCWGYHTLYLLWEVVQQRSSCPRLASWSSCLKTTANKEDGITSVGHTLRKYLAWSWDGLTPVHSFTAFRPSRIRTWPGAGLHEASFLSAFFSKRLTDATNCWNLFFFLVTSTWYFQDLLIEQNWTHCGS